MSSRSNGVTKVLLIWFDDLVREVVARVLELLDPADQLGAVLGEALEQLQPEPRDVDRVRGRAREQLEELLALGCEADPHGAGCLSEPGREGARDGEAAAGSCGCLDRAACRGDDVLDDREAEARAAASSGRGRRGRSARRGAAGRPPEPRSRRPRRGESARRRPRCTTPCRSRRARVADRVLDQVPDHHLQHPRPQRQIERGGALDPERRRRRRAARSAASATTWSMTGSALIEPSATTAATALELAEEQHVVDQLADSLDLAFRPPDQVVLVGARQQRALEQRHQPRQRRPQLVGDGGGEAGPELLVGGEVAGRAQVDERLLALAERRRGSRSASARRGGAARPAKTQPSTSPSRDSRARRLAVTTRRDSSRTITISRLSSIRARARSTSAAETRAAVGAAGARRRRASPDCHQIVTGSLADGRIYRRCHASRADRRGRRRDRRRHGASSRGGRLRRRGGRAGRARSRPAALRAPRRMRARPDAARARRLGADRDGPRRGDRHADRRRQRARHRGRPHPGARDSAPTTTW